MNKHSLLGRDRQTDWIQQSFLLAVVSLYLDFLKNKIYKTIILPVVLYGCETWSLTLREECWQRVIENRILRRIFGSKRHENGEWRRLHNKGIHSLYCSPNIVRVIKSRRLRWAGHVARMEEGRSAFKISTVTPTGKRHFWRPRGMGGQY